MIDQPPPDFEGAVYWAMRALNLVVCDGQLKTYVSEPSEVQLRFELRIKQGRDDQGVFYNFSEEADKVLHELSASDRGAFDLYAKIIASRLFRGQPLSFLMRVFAGLMVVQGIVPPKPSKKKSALFFVHCYIYLIARQIVQKFNVRLTSNDAGPDLSACGAISNALGNLGHAKTPRAIKEILVGRTSAELRDAAIDVWMFANEWREDDPDQAAEWDNMRAELLGRDVTEIE